METEVKKPVDLFWTYIQDGEIYDADFATSDEALENANERFEEKIQDQNEGLRNGAIFDDEIELIRYFYNEDGEREIVARNPSIVSYEHYHGDLKEHGTW